MAIPTPMSKVIPVNLDFKNSSISNWKPFNTGMGFWTNDIGTAFLEFSTELDLTGTVASIVLENQYDKSLVQKTITEITSSPFYYQLGDEIQHEGRWFVQVSVKKGEETIVSNSFAFMVNVSVGHGKVARLISIETFETLATQLTALQTDISNYLETAETNEAIRVSTYDEIVLAEEARKEAEDIREANDISRGDTATADHTRANTDHSIAVLDHSTALTDHSTSTTDHTTALADHSIASSDHTTATTDHTRANTDHTRANTDHTTALADHDSYEGLLDDGVLATNIENKLLYLETTYTPELLSVKQQLADTQADLQAGIGALTADAEVVTARSSEVKGRTFNVLDARLEEIETDHKTILRKIISNDEPMHYDKVLGEYVNVGKYWDAYRDGKIYTTEFNNYEVSPSPTGTKKDANAGLVAVPSTNLVAGQDDYANIGLFKPVEVNAFVDANDDYHITAIKGDGRFKRDGTNGDVYIMNMLGYIKRFDTPTTWGYSYSDTLYAGFNVLPEAVKPDGTVRPFLLHAKYIAGVGSDGKLASISGVNPEFNSMSHDGQITKFKAKGEQYSGKTTHDDFWMKLMLFLKYATTNSEAVMRGCISYYLQYKPSIYESGVSRVVLTNAQANALVVGSRVSIGNYAGGTKTDDRGSTLVHNVANRVKITSITALPDGLNSAVNVDAPAFDTNATTTITTVPWGSGACDSVLGNDGSPISNTSGKEPLIINGIETMVGGYEVIQNLMIYNDNTDPLDYKVKVYACYDAKLYKAGSPSADYKLLSVLMAQTNNTWQYISKLGVDPNHPTALIPVAATASSTTGFADGIYTNAPTTGYRAWLSLGYLGIGSLCGFFCVGGYLGLGFSGWGFLGRLSATGRSRGELA